MMTDREAELYKLSHEHPILLYDGQCILCNNVVQWAWRHDKNGVVRYAMLQDVSGAEDYDTVELVHRGVRYIRSSAILSMASALDLPWSALSLLRIIPQPIRDAIYSWMSSNRYRWWGKKESCMLPPPEWEHRYIRF